MQKKTKNGILAVIAIIVLLGLATGGTYKMMVTGDAKPTLQGMVGTPQFASATCSAGAFAERGTYDMSNAPEFAGEEPSQIKVFYCAGTIDDKKINTNYCEFKYNVGSMIGGLRIFKVPASYSVTTSTELKKQPTLVNNIAYMSATDGWKSAGTYNQNSEYFAPTDKIVVWAQDVPLGGKLDAGDLQVQVWAQQYDLYSTTDAGLKNIAPNTCDLSKIHTNGGTRDVLQSDLTKALTNSIVKKNSNGQYTVLFTSAINYISSLRPVAETTDIIKRNNAWVWVMQPRQVCPIEPSPAEFGSIKYYADCRESAPNNAPEIVCMPSTPNCKADGTGYLTTNDPKTCNFYGSGLPVGYYPNYIDGRYDQQCLFKCVDGKVSNYDCITIQNCGANEKFDFTKKACVNLGGEPIVPPTVDNTLLLIAGAVLVGLMILTSAAMLSGKKR